MKPKKFYKGLVSKFDELESHFIDHRYPAMDTNNDVKRHAMCALYYQLEAMRIILNYLKPLPTYNVSPSEGDE